MYHFGITSRAKINQTKNKALGRSAASRCSSMNYGLFIKTLGPPGPPGAKNWASAGVTA